MTFQNTDISATEKPSVMVDLIGLKRALEATIKAVQKKTTVPILANVLIKGHGDMVTITGTDLDIEIIRTLPAAADSRFNITVQAHKLLDLLKKAPKCDFVSLTQIEGEQEDDCPAVNVEFEKVNYTLNAIDHMDFPSLQGPENHHSIAFDAEWLLDTFEALKGAISTEETRYYLNGVFMCAEPDNLSLIACDGHRLYKQDCPLPSGSDGMPNVIIPRKTIEILIKLLKGYTGSISVDFSESKIRYKFGPNCVTSKIVDGTFPDYNRVIPQHNKMEMISNAADFGQAVSAVALISSERGRAVKLTLDETVCALEVNNPDSGSADASVAMQYKGDPISIGYNNQYFTEMLKVVSPCGGDFTAEFSDPDSPARFTGTRNDFLAVVMPMRV